MTIIKFGTDGWRAVLGKDFNYENVNKVINGISTYIYNHSKYEKPVIIGYDPRNKADEFALYIAEKMADSGFCTELSDKIIATPILAYSALKKEAYAIMLTASHNPSEYLGIKFIPPYGGPAEDYIVKEITDNLEISFNFKRIAQKLKKTDFENDYIKRIEEIINFDIIRKSKLKINYDGHNGAGARTFLRILKENNIPYNAQNIERDITFGGFLPDPKEEYLHSLKQLCIKTGLIGLSNDGDGDRFGVFDEKGNFISPNNIIAMLLKHLTKNRNYTGKLAKTVGASAMLDLYAKKYSIEVIETPVGFKWLGAAMRNNDVIIAGEESGGLSIKGHIPEKDGILANLLIMEMIAFSSKTLKELNNDFLSELNRKFINKRMDLKLNSINQQDFYLEKIKNLNEINNIKVIKTTNMDGVKLYLEDESTVLARKSGTEPLLRIYFETNSEEKIEQLKQYILKSM